MSEYIQKTINTGEKVKAYGFEHLGTGEVIRLRESGIPFKPMLFSTVQMEDD